MSETVETGDESLVEDAEALDTKALTDMEGKFDPNKARELVEQDKPKSTGLVEIEDDNTEYLAAMPEKQEKELSPQDAANEYLSLLDELSQDFTNPYYSDKREGRSHYANNITTDLGRKYSDNPHYRWRGYASTEAGDTDGTMLRIASADCILACEIGWREEGQRVGDEINGISEELAKLDEKYESKGRLGKLLGKRKYQRERTELINHREGTARKLRNCNLGIAKELAISYNENGDYDYDRGNNDHGERKNEERNRRFFGLDDPERAKKIERAIELRKKYISEWQKKD